MASRKDLLKAQSFTTRRLVSAFVNRDPDNPTGPLRRALIATFVGVMIGVLILGGSALIGFLKPGQTRAWKNDQGTLISDVNSGLLFVYYRNQRGEEVLLPMADVASARLAIGSSEIKTVRTDKLEGIRQDIIRAIPDAPRQLPSGSQMNPYPTRLCSIPGDDPGTRYASLEIGKEARPGGTSVEDDTPVVIESEDGESFIVINGLSHHLWRPDDASTSPAAASLMTIRAGDGWLTSLPTGERIEPLPIENRGGRPTSRQVQPDTRIGSVAMVQASTINPEPRYFVQLADGLAQTSFLNMATEMAFFDTGKSDPTLISEQDASENMSPTTPLLATPDIPLERPKGADSSTRQQPSICATYVNPETSDGRQTPVITIDDVTPELPAYVTKNPPNYSWVDYLDIAPLHGVLLQESNVLASESDQAPTFLVAGNKVYGIPDAASREALGYAPDAKNSPPLLRVPGSMINFVGPVVAKLSRDQISPELPADLNPSE